MTRIFLMTFSRFSSSGGPSLFSFLLGLACSRFPLGDISLLYSWHLGTLFSVPWARLLLGFSPVQPWPSPFFLSYSKVPCIFPLRFFADTRSFISLFISYCDSVFFDFLSSCPPSTWLCPPLRKSLVSLKLLLVYARASVFPNFYSAIPPSVSGSLRRVNLSAVLTSRCRYFQCFSFHLTGSMYSLSFPPWKVLNAVPTGVVERSPSFEVLLSSPFSVSLAGVEGVSCFFRFFPLLEPPKRTLHVGPMVNIFLMSFGQLWIDHILFSSWTSGGGPFCFSLRSVFPDPNRTWFSPFKAWDIYILPLV